MMSFKSALLSSLMCLPFFAFGGDASSAPATAVLTVDFAMESSIVRPRIGFLGGLHDETPDDLIQVLHPGLWRIGHQFRGRIKAGLIGAIERVEKFGAQYKLCMSDLIDSKPNDWTKYEADVKKLVADTGPHASSILWEPANEPDVSFKPIDKYYELYAHAFKALREANKDTHICGPSFAFPSHDKYRAFLDYCREHHLECNAICWHFTGWDPNYPEQAKWNLGGMREFLDLYKEQKIAEIHCDEWGAGPDKPGHQHPGRMIVWFHYLEDVFKVDRACRANWGHSDDYLGNVITAKSEPLPVYSAFRWYASTRGQTRVPVEGNSKTVACLASKENGHREILLGSINKGSVRVTLELKNAGPENQPIKVEQIPAENLDEPAMDGGIVECKDAKITQEKDLIRIELNNVAENAAYRVLIGK